jgi:RNA polymerase sigma-70 factor (ECF subfamily)
LVSKVNQVVGWHGTEAGANGPASSIVGAVRAAPATTAAPNFDALYQTHFVEVARWVRALGASAGDIEDLTQEVFIILRRKLDGFDGHNVRGFLYRIAQRTVRDHRRSAWFRNLFCMRAPEARGLPSETPTALQVLELREKRKIVERILARMSEKRRSTFVLFEIEGYSGEEISQIQGVPLATVWTRLHHARRDFLRFVAELPPGKEP